MSGGSIQIPNLLHPDRRAAFWGLVGIAACEVAAQVAATGVLKGLLVGATGGVEAIILLTITGLAAAGFSFARDVTGERLGLEYANHVRRALARQAIAVASGKGPSRFGIVALRMTGDLSALKDWAQIGVCGGLAGVLGLIGAILAAWMTAGWAGLMATLIGPLVALTAISLLIGRLHRDVRERRRRKGRLSATIGDLLLGASASAAYAAEPRAIAIMDKAASAALTAQTRQVGTETLIRLPALLALPFGASMAVLLERFGLQPTGGMAGWAALLFALSLASLACAQLTKGAAQFVERRIAIDKLNDLVAIANTVRPVTPRGKIRFKKGPGVSLVYNDTQLIEPGQQIAYPRGDANIWLNDVLEAHDGVSVNDVAAPQFRNIDWARRIAYAGPARGLTRGRLELVLAARRQARPEAIRCALNLAGLPESLLDDDQKIDPQTTAISEDMCARLRLARAVAHDPRLLIIDDPWLSEDTALMSRVRLWCAQNQISLIVIVAEHLTPQRFSVAS